MRTVASVMLVRLAGSRSRTALAELCGLSRRALYALIEGKADPSYRTRCRIRDALGVPLDAWDLPDAPVAENDTEPGRLGSALPTGT